MKRFCGRRIVAIGHDLRKLRKGPTRSGPRPAVMVTTGRTRGDSMRRKIGMTLLYVAGGLVIAGSMYDLFVPAVPANLLSPVIFAPQVPGIVANRFTSS